MPKFKTAMIAMTLAASLAGSQAFAAETLAPGKPAGVHAAQRGSGHLLLIAGVATLVVVGIVVATQSSDSAACGSACTIPSTTTT